MCRIAYDLRRNSYFHREKLDLVHKMGGGKWKEKWVETCISGQKKSQRELERVA